MKLKDEIGWLECIAQNMDPYGACVVKCAEKWANLMESKINDGCALENIAKQTFHQADTEHITDFMYGCAVSILAQVWEYGEELRLWHNIDTQIHHEGEIANETGKVLDPALLRVK